MIELAAPTGKELNLVIVPVFLHLPMAEIVWGMVRESRDPLSPTIVIEIIHQRQTSCLLSSDGLMHPFMILDGLTQLSCLRTAQPFGRLLSRGVGI
jgi:hypothetical protein